MEPAGQLGQPVRFGIFELDVRAGELRKNGSRIKLQEQPFQILKLLLERPGEVITREEIQQKLWPDGTFVDFEHSLNAAVKRLRDALQDSADNPRFIETLPRRGYKFIYPVEGAHPSTHSAMSQGMWVWVSAGGLAVLLLLAVGLNLGGLRNRLFGGVAPGEITSIAVLPLNNLSGDPAQDYFSDAMTEALITELGKISALRVISRQSVMQFKKTELSLPEIAAKLGVDAIVEGTALQVGDEVRITAQLIRAEPEEYLWAESYDRELKDILALHGDVARAIAREIQIAVTPEEETRLAATRPVNPEAYQLYLKGNFQLGKLTEEGFGKALKNFHEAIEKAPDYAPAYAGAGLAYLGLGSWHTAISPKTVREKAKQNALKALELDDALGDAYIVLGRIKQLHEWDWTGADRSFKKGMELNPGFTFGRILYANYLTAMGRFEESIEVGKRTVEIDPLSPVAYNELGWALLHAGRYDEGLEQYQKGLELVPNFPQSHGLLGGFYMRRGMTEEALEQARKVESLLGGTLPPSYMGGLGYFYGMVGQRSKALNILNQLKKRAEKEYVPASALAKIYLGLGNTEQALQLLEQAYADHDVNLVLLKVSWKYDPLRSNPRFQDLMRRMNFPE